MEHGNKWRGPRTRSAKCKTALDEARTGRRYHQDLKPSLVDALFTRGAAYREWLERDRSLAAAVSARETELTQARAECGARQNELRRLAGETASLKAEINTGSRRRASG